MGQRRLGAPLASIVYVIASAAVRVDFPRPFRMYGRSRLTVPARIRELKSRERGYRHRFARTDTGYVKVLRDERQADSTHGS